SEPLGRQVDHVDLEPGLPLVAQMRAHAHRVTQRTAEFLAGDRLEWRCEDRFFHNAPLKPQEGYFSANARSRSTSTATPAGRRTPARARRFNSAFRSSGLGATRKPKLTVPSLVSTT